MNNLIIFNYNENEIRIITINGEPWWVLKDVCDVLEPGSTHKAADKPDDDERSLIPLVDSIGKKQEMTIINESGLYALILSSKPPKAKQFKRWVTSEVLPSIRKSSSYGKEIGIEDVAKIITQTITEQLTSIISTTVETALKAAVNNNNQIRSQLEKENTKQRQIRQAEGIAAAKTRGVVFGRPMIKMPEEAVQYIDLYITGTIKAADAAAKLGVSGTTFRRWVNATKRKRNV